MGPSESPNGQLVARLLLQAAQTVLPDEPPSQNPVDGRFGDGVRRRALSDGGGPIAGRLRQCPIRVVLVCGPPRSGKSTYIVETFDGVVEPLPFETLTYRNFLATAAYPRVMPPRRREMIALAIFQEFTEDAIRRCQCHAASEALAVSADGVLQDPVVVMEGPFYYRSFRHAVVDGLRGVMRECDALECRWVGYPRVVGDAVRRAGYDTFKHCAGRLQVPSVEEGFDELRVLAIPQRSIHDELRLRVDALNGRDAVTEYNLLCRPDLSADGCRRADSLRPLCAVSDLEGRKVCGARA